MNKDILALIMNALFANIKDAKSLALYALTLLISIIGFMLITSQGELISFAKNFSRNTVVEQVQAERVLAYPKIARERASMLYIQSSADAVFIAEYKPKFVNNYQDIVAWEGSVTVNPSKMMNIVIDKTSSVYQQHVIGHNVSYKFSSDHSWSADNFITSGKEYKDVGIVYLYTCPIFDLDNSYSGYVGIGYTSIPYTNTEEEGMLEEYLERICDPHARALGRKK